MTGDAGESVAERSPSHFATIEKCSLVHWFINELVNYCTKSVSSHPLGALIRHGELIQFHFPIKG